MHHQWFQTILSYTVPAIVTILLWLMSMTWFLAMDSVFLALGSLTNGRMPLHAAKTSPRLTTNKYSMVSKVSLKWLSFWAYSKLRVHRWLVYWLARCLTKCGRLVILLKPIGYGLMAIASYSHSLRDATGPVDMYSHIPTSTQVTCIAA